MEYVLDVLGLGAETMALMLDGLRALIQLAADVGGWLYSVFVEEGSGFKW